MSRPVCTATCPSRRVKNARRHAPAAGSDGGDHRRQKHQRPDPNEHRDEAYQFFDTLKLDEEKTLIAAQPLKEIRARLKFMMDVGLGYLTLDRASRTLSGGEAQRIRLATQVGSGLVGCCYVLDEPTIGLHRRDNDRLLEILKRLRDIGNTVLVVEHDDDVIAEADHIIDIGPAAGEHGGELVVAGHAGGCLPPASGRLPGSICPAPSRSNCPKAAGKAKMSDCIEVKNASENNLKDISVKFPLGVLTCVTGVSGSGKSTLVTEILLKGLKRRLYALA